MNFFASWCSRLHVELVALGSPGREPGTGVMVPGVDSDDQRPSVAQAMLATAQAGYPVGVDPLAQLSTQYLVTALPATYFIGRDGRVVGAAFGPQSTAKLSGWVKRLTKDRPKPR